MRTVSTTDSLAFVNRTLTMSWSACDATVSAVIRTSAGLPSADAATIRSSVEDTTSSRGAWAAGCAGTRQGRGTAQQADDCQLPRSRSGEPRRLVAAAPPLGGKPLT